LRGTIPILKVAGTLLVTLQTDLHDAVADAFQEDLLSVIEREPVPGLLIEISALDTVDSYVARVLTETGKMARLMGTETVIVGMRPEVAATLVRMGYSFGTVRTALNVDEGLALLGVRISVRK
jgi:rsbT antagonist protein RsbS